MLSDPQPITRDTFREKIFASDPESIREKEIEFLFDILDYNDDDVIDKKDFRIISWIVWCKMAMECKYYYFVIDIEIYYSFAAKSDFAITTLSSTVTLKTFESIARLVAILCVPFILQSYSLPWRLRSLVVIANLNFWLL